MTNNTEQLLHEIEASFEIIDHILSAPEVWAGEAHDVHMEYVREARTLTTELLAQLRADLNVSAPEMPAALMHDILE